MSRNTVVSVIAVGTATGKDIPELGLLDKQSFVIALFPEIATEPMQIYCFRKEMNCHDIVEI